MAEAEARQREERAIERGSRREGCSTKEETDAMRDKDFEDRRRGTMAANQVARAPTAQEKGTGVEGNHPPTAHSGSRPPALRTARAVQAGAAGERGHTSGDSRSTGSCSPLQGDRAEEEVRDHLRVVWGGGEHPVSDIQARPDRIPISDPISSSNAAIRSKVLLPEMHDDVMYL